MSRTLLLLLYHVPAVYDVCLRPSDVCNLGRTRGNRVARGGTLLRAGHEAIAARVSFFKSILTCACGKRVSWGALAAGAALPKKGHTLVPTLKNPYSLHSMQA